MGNLLVTNIFPPKNEIKVSKSKFNIHPYEASLKENEGTIVGPRWSLVFFLDEVLPNYDVKNRISTYTKGISTKKERTKLARFQNKK